MCLQCEKTYIVLVPLLDSELFVDVFVFTSERLEYSSEPKYDDIHNYMKNAVVGKKVYNLNEIVEMRI